MATRHFFEVALLAPSFYQRLGFEKENEKKKKKNENENDCMKVKVVGELY